MNDPSRISGEGAQENNLALALATLARSQTEPSGSRNMILSGRSMLNPTQQLNKSGSKTSELSAQDRLRCLAAARSNPTNIAILSLSLFRFYRHRPAYKVSPMYSWFEGVFLCITLCSLLTAW